MHSRLTGNQHEMQRRYLSGELIKALRKGKWKALLKDSGTLGYSGSGANFRIIGAGRSSPYEVDYHVLSFTVPSTVIGAKPTPFVMPRQRVMLKDYSDSWEESTPRQSYNAALDKLEARGLYCGACGGLPKHHDWRKGAEQPCCPLQELLATPHEVWLAEADRVRRNSRYISREGMMCALVIFDHAVVSEQVGRVGVGETAGR